MTAEFWSGHLCNFSSPGCQSPTSVAKLFQPRNPSSKLIQIKTKLKKQHHSQVSISSTPTLFISIQRLAQGLHFTMFHWDDVIQSSVKDQGGWLHLGLKMSQGTNFNEFDGIQREKSHDHQSCSAKSTLHRKSFCVKETNMEKVSRPLFLHRLPLLHFMASILRSKGRLQWPKCCRKSHPWACPQGSQAAQFGMHRSTNRV